MNELEELKNKVAALEKRIEELAVHCKTMFELQLENQETTSRRISNISDRIHSHIMNNNTTV